MVNTEIRLIILFAAKNGEALYSQQKQDQELTVARGSSVPSIRRQNASGRLWVKAPMVGGGAGFVV